MEARQGNALQALRGVQAFIDAHADILGPVSRAGTRRKFDAQVAALREHVETQSGSDMVARGGTRKLCALRRALIDDHMRPIACIAAAELRSVPEFHPFRVPAARPTTERLYAAALGMVDAAEPHACGRVRGSGTRHGLPRAALRRGGRDARASRFTHTGTCAARRRDARH